MNLSTLCRVALFVGFLATLPMAAEKPQRTYVKGVITGYESRLDTWGMGGNSNKRREKVYELKGADMIYKVGYCGAFQAGQFTPGQTVEYRVQGERLYIRHDDDKEFGCKIEGSKTVEAAKSEDTKTEAAPAKQ